MTSYIVELNSVYKSFNKRFVVKDLSFVLRHGECIALLGPNGAGKTTTINMVIGLVVPSKGEINVFNLKILNNLHRIKMDIGVAPQLDNLDPDLSVMENLVIYASYFGIKRADAVKRAEELIEFFSLKNMAGSIIQELSGGQRRSLIIARALINRPRLLILDEPTIGLDPRARYLIWQRLEALKREGTTMLLTSHYMEEVERLSDRVIIMANGEKVADGEPAFLIKHHVGDYVIEISDDNPLLLNIEMGMEGCEYQIDNYAGKAYLYLKGSCGRIEGLLSHKDIVKRPPNLEDLFMRLTGKGLGAL